MIKSNELLKEWGENDFELLNKKALATVRSAMNYKIFKFTAGAEPLETCGGWTNERLENLFGFPYVSSGSTFAGIWNTNTQAEAYIFNNRYLFRCMAISTEGVPVFVLDNESNQIYLTFEELKQESHNQAAAEYAKELERTQKQAHQIAQEVTKMLATYNGKKFGEKTKAAIYEQIHTISNKYGENFRISLSGGSNPVWQSLNIDKYISGKFYGYKSFNINAFEWIDEQTNTIKAPIYKASKESEQKTATQAHAEQSKLKNEIKKICNELLPLINKYNENNRILQLEDRLTYNDMSINLHSLAKYGFED